MLNQINSTELGRLKNLAQTCEDIGDYHTSYWAQKRILKLMEKGNADLKVLA